MRNAPQKIDYSRCPMWWWSVNYLSAWDDECVHMTFVRAADYEAAALKAERLRHDMRRGAALIPQVRPMMNRSGLARGTHEFAGYGDE